MQFKSLAAAAALALAAASSAQASSFFGTVNGAGNFTVDAYTVTVGTTFNVTGGVASNSFIVPVTVGPGITFNITVDALTLSGVTFGSFSDNDLSDGFSFSGISAGTYTLKLIGSASSPLGGIYAGNITTTPVPEAQTTALALAGLGVVGLLARRRKAS